jgi:hypothetical protein
MATYNIDAPAEMAEGVTEIITVITTGVAAGTTLYWAIDSANSPKITLASTTWNAISGSFVVDASGESTFTITTKADKKTSTVKPFLLVNILIYNRATAPRTLLANTAPNVIIIKDTSQAKSASFGTLPVSVQEGNTYTISINTTGYADRTNLLAAIYVSKITQGSYGATLTSGGYLNEVASSAYSGSGVRSEDFDFDSLTSAWNIVYPLTSPAGAVTAQSKLYYATPVNISGNTGSFTLTINTDDLKENASLEYFKILILDPATPRSYTAEYTNLVTSPSISIIDSSSDTIPVWAGGTLTWNIGTTTVAGRTASRFYNSYLLASYLKASITVKGTTTLTTSPQNLWWEIWLEKYTPTDINSSDNMLPEEFTPFSGYFAMTNNTTGSGCTGYIKFDIKALPAAIKAWPTRRYNIRVRETQNGKILLTTVGIYQTKQIYWICTNDTNTGPYSGTLSGPNWRMVNYDAPIKTMDVATIPEYVSGASYTKGTYVKISYPDALTWSFGEVARSENDYTKGTTVYGGFNSDFLNALYNTYGYTTPTLYFGSPSITYSTAPTTATYLGTSYTAVGENNVTIEASYNTKNIAPDTVVNWTLGIFPSGSLIPQNLFIAPTSGKSIVRSDLRWSIKLTTLENFNTQTVGVQGFKLPNSINIIVQDTSQASSTATNAVARYTTSEFPTTIYTNKSFAIRIKIAIDVVIGQVVLIKLYGNGGIYDVQLNGVAVSTTATSVSGYAGVEFNATVSDSQVFIVRLKSSSTGLVAFALYEGGILQLNQTGFVKNESLIYGQTYGTEYILTGTDYGIEVYSKRNPKQVTYNTNAVTWNQVDIFTVAGSSYTTKTYGSFLSDREIKVQQIFLNAPPVDRKAIAHDIAISKYSTGATITISGGSEQAQILVLMR